MSSSKSPISSTTPLLFLGVIVVLFTSVTAAENPAQPAPSHTPSTSNNISANTLEPIAAAVTSTLTAEPTPSATPTATAEATNASNSDTTSTNSTNNFSAGTTGSTSSATPAASTTQNDINSIIVEGLILPQQKVSLASPSEGLIKKILVPEGATVKEGQLIAQLDDREEQIQLQNAEFQASKLRDILASLERLFNEKVTSRMEYNKALLQMEQAESDRNLHALRTEKMTIKAPCDAYVLRLLKHPGESVQRLEKFAELVVTGQIHITSYVDAQHLGKIPVGTIASVSPGEGMSPVEGIVEVSDPVLDPGGKVFRIKVRIDHPSVELIPGMRAQVELHEKQ